MKKKIFTLLTLLLCVCSGTWADEAVLYYAGTSANSINVNGFTIAITGNTGKSWSNGNGSISYNGNTYNTLKNSNGAQNTITCPTGKVATKVVFYATSNADTAGKLSEFDGESCNDEVSSLKDYTNFTTIEKDINNKNSFTFTFSTKQVCFIAVVTYETPDSRTKATLSFPQSSYNVTLGNSFTAPTLTADPAAASSEVVYSSSNTAAATVDATTGTVSLVAGGKTTITASISGSETYRDASASYELTVVDPNAAGYTAEATTITWAFNTGAAGQTASIAYGTATEDLFKNSNVSIGANLSYAGTQELKDAGGTATGVVSTKVKQNDAGSSTEQKNAIKFTITPKTGLTFTPTRVSFLATRCGTDGGKMEISWIDSEHSAVALESTTAAKNQSTPARDNYTPNFTEYSYDLTAKGATATTGECGLQIITHSANGKSYAFGQIVIEGTIDGQISAVTTYDITVTTDNEAGSVNPTSATVDEGDGLTLEATANTGYAFLNWTKASDNSWNSTSNPLTVSDIQADETYTANFKNLYDITYDLSAEGVEKGTVSNILQKEYASAADKFTAPQNVYLTKNGYSFVKWTDGTNDYTPGTEYTLTSDITLQPVFAENTQSLAMTTASTVVTWNFRASEASLNMEGATGYYVKQAQVNGDNLDVVMTIDATSGKLNNVNRTDEWAQANGDTKLTIPAISGMQIVAKGYNQFSSTTIAGSAEYTATTTSPFTATYTYTGSDATIDIVIGDDISYLSSIAVTYPKTHTYVDVTSVGYRTFASSSALDFSEAIEGLTAYKATISSNKVLFTALDCAVPAKEGMLLKAAEGRYYIPVATGTPADIENVFVGVTSATEVPAGSFVLMRATTDNQGTGFYKTKNAFTVGANTAYLPADVASARTFIGFNKEETTGIADVRSKMEDVKASECYDLQGRRVAQPQKGLYIMNGKKVIIK